MAGERILVIDDHAVNRRLVQVLLHSRGYEVCEAVSAAEGFALLKAKPPRVILMDLRLPGMDGLTATRTLKTDPATRDIPNVAVTSYAMKGAEEKALDAGCCAYVTKPLDKAFFLETVARVLAESNVLVTGASLLGGFKDFESPDWDFPEYSVPGAPPGTKFDQFPGSPTIADETLVAFKGNFTVGVSGKTGVFFRDVSGESNRTYLVANSLVTEIPGTGEVFGSTAPSTAAGSYVFFVGSITRTTRC